MTLFERFCNPTSEFRQAPFWFWNHRLDTETLSWQIEQMAEKGLGGFVMHARHGLITPYLSDEWFECIRFCCNKAREMGMIAWAYDERDWPSGPAGGAVIADRANRLSYLRLVTSEMQGPCTVTFGDGVVCAYVSSSGEPPRRVQGKDWQAPSGPCQVVQAVRFECPAILWFESYLDTLDPNACRRFIQSTYDRHEEKLGDLKALGLAGFFTDEPAFSTYPDDLARIPWTPGLPDAFLAMKGYDLLDHLRDLFGQTELGPQVRYDYWDVAVSLFESSFFKSIEEWCDARGLKLIGHPLGEEPLFFQFRCLGNIFYLLKHFHMPGMDHLTIHVGKGGAGRMSPKMIESAALLAGRERTMTETFGESGWGLSLREMKWMADWQIANGINYIIPHAFYYSVAGRRKKDSPPSEFVQAPFWPYYRYFADYTARLTSAMTGGEHIAKVAVLYPMSSVWSDFIPGLEMTCTAQEIEEAFAPLGEALQRIHRDFVVVDEQSFAQARVEGNTFRVNDLSFNALILPKMSAIHEDALEALRRVAQSCVTIAVGDNALRVLKKDSGGRGSRRAEGIQPLDPARQEPRPPESVLPAEIPGVRLSAGRRFADLEQELSQVAPDVMIDRAPDVQYLHRRTEGKDLYFFANTGREALDTVVSLETVGLADLWDAETGTRRTAPRQRVAGDRLEVPLHFPPMGSHLVVIDPAPPADPARSQVSARSQVELGNEVSPFKASLRIPVEAPWHFTPENGNFAALRNWTLIMEAHQHVNELRYSAQFITTEHIANMRLILDGVPAQAYNVHEAARPIMAHETDAVVLLDGKPLTQELPWEIDPKFRVLDLAGLCKPGTHHIEIAIKNNGWFPQPGLEEYAWVAGDFHLDDRAGLPCLVPVHGIGVGSWEKQGFAFFSGTGDYCAEVVVPEEVAGKRAFLNAGKVGDLLEVEVNGRLMGVRPWPPYSVEVTSALCPGRNLFVLKVANSGRNFFEGPDGNHPSGLLSEVWLEIE